MEVPQSGIRCVVQAFVLAFGEHLGYPSIFDVVRESAENIPGFRMASGGQRQPLEADHRVASPIREPVITRDHRANIVACRLRSSGITHARVWCDDELICS